MSAVKQKSTIVEFALVVRYRSANIQRAFIIRSMCDLLARRGSPLVTKVEFKLGQNERAAVFVVVDDCIAVKLHR